MLLCDIFQKVYKRKKYHFVKMGNNFLIKDSEPYNLLLKHSLSFIFVVNKKANLIDMNDRGAKELEYSRDEILNTSISNYLSAESLAVVLKKLALRFQNKATGPVDVIAKKRDKSLMYLRTSGDIIKIYDNDNNWIGVLVSAINITEMREAEEELKNSEEKYRLLANSAKEGIYSTNGRGDFSTVNKAMMDIFDFSEEELINMPAWDLAVPEKREETRNIFLKRIQKKDSTPVEVECLRKDGTRIYCKVSVNHFFKEGVFGLVEDITEKRLAQEAKEQSESMYSNLFESLGDGIWVIDKNLKIRDVNTKACNILGYTKKELIGHNIINFYADSRKVEKAILKNLNQTLMGGDVYVERQFVTKSGDVIDVAINTRKIKDKSLVIESIRNITEIKDLKSKVKKLEEQRKIKLTQKEKQVFYALTRWPDYSDQQIADQIKIKRSTVTAIKNKLKKEKYYQVLRVPSYSLIDCSILSITKHQFNQQLKEKHEFKSNEIDELIFHLSSNNDSIGIFIGEEFSSLKEDLDTYCDNYEKEGFIEDVEQVYFPIKSMLALRCFDFAPLLKDMFNIDEEYSTNATCFNPNNRNLTNKEKRILQALVRYPNKTDTYVAEITDSARVTVSSIKKRLLGEGYLKTVIVPDMEKLGDHLMIFTHGYMGIDDDAKEVVSMDKNDWIPATTFFRVMGKKDIIDIGIYEDVEQVYFPIKSMLALRCFDFAPLVYSIPSEKYYRILLKLWKYYF